jgi:hypothetical protein
MICAASVVWGAAHPEQDACYVLRELHKPAEIVSLVRLRHRIYFEEQAYGSPKALGLDLTAHDTRTRLLGIFHGDRLVGGIRAVYRTEQSASIVFRALRAVAEDETPEAAPLRLPSEEAFDLSRVPGLSPQDVHVELGRFVLGGMTGVPWLAARAIVGALAVLQADHCPYYLYSCGISIARRYARVTRPRWTLHEPIAPGIASDNFTFPVPTIAAIARPEDAGLGDTLLEYSRQLDRTGRIVLNGAEADA